MLVKITQKITHYNIIKVQMQLLQQLLESVPLWMCLEDHLKGSSTQKMKMLSSFNHPQVVANLFEFLSSAEHKGRYLEERLEFWHH